MNEKTNSIHVLVKISPKQRLIIIFPPNKWAVFDKHKFPKPGELRMLTLFVIEIIVSESHVNSTYQRISNSFTSVQNVNVGGFSSHKDNVDKWQRRKYVKHFIMKHPSCTSI